MSAIFEHRFVAVNAKWPLNGHVFRVVNADNKDMILWSELSSGGGNGMSWRGTMAEFRKTFGILKAAPG